MIGALESVLRDLYGDPTIHQDSSLVEFRWNNEIETRRCILYKSAGPKRKPIVGFEVLNSVYGDALGATLLCGSLKVSMLGGVEMYGLYQFAELQADSNVLHANSIDPKICFFADSANVWFFGQKDEQLFSYDSCTEEIECLGPSQKALKGLLTEWEQAKA